MNQLFKGVLVTVTATGIACSIPANNVVAQAPAQMVWEVTSEETPVNAKIELLTNPIIRNGEEMETCVPAFAVQQAADEVQERLEELRIQQEKEKREKEALRKKKLEEKKKKAEEKRRKEILACCGVAAGTRDQQILERIVEAEAGGESFKGKLLVANVVLNRVKSKRFPSTIEKVVFAHRQFSPVWDGRYYKVKVSKHTKKAVQAALRGQDPSKGALYFMQRSAADRSNVTWFDTALTRLFKYGCHEFYK